MIHLAVALVVLSATCAVLVLGSLVVPGVRSVDSAFIAGTAAALVLSSTLLWFVRWSRALTRSLPRTCSHHAIPIPGDIHRQEILAIAIMALPGCGKLPAVMRFGAAIEAPIHWPDLLELAIEVDRDSQYDFFWISDALSANGPPDDPRLEAWSALAAIAQATSRVRLGVLVSGNAYRHPAVVAKMVTTIDQISHGRVELGIGAGWPGENRRYGIDFWTRRERADRLDEALRVIKLLWTQPRPKFEGRYYTLDEPPYSPPNVQQPHPPILIGGGSERMLKLMASFADAVNPMEPWPARGLSAAYAKVDEYCLQLGRDPDGVRRTIEVPLFLNDDPTVQERAVQWAIAQDGGTEDDVRRRSLFGSAQQVRAGVQRLADAGVQELYVFQLPRVHRKSLLQFSEEVIPAFR